MRTTLKVSIAILPAERETMDELLAAVPYANHHALCRLAVKLGLEQLRKDPARIPQLLTGQRMRFPAADLQALIGDNTEDGK